MGLFGKSKSGDSNSSSDHRQEVVYQGSGGHTLGSEAQRELDEYNRTGKMSWMEDDS